MNKQALIGIIVVCVLILGIALFFVLKGGKNNTTPSLNTTLSPSPSLNTTLSTSPSLNTTPSPSPNTAPAPSSNTSPMPNGYIPPSSTTTTLPPTTLPPSSTTTAPLTSTTTPPPTSTTTAPPNLDVVGAQFYIRNPKTNYFIGTNSLVGPFSNQGPNQSQIFTVAGINSGQLVLNPPLWVQGVSTGILSGSYNLNFESGANVSKITFHSPQANFYIGISGFNEGQVNNSLLGLSTPPDDKSEIYGTRVPVPSS